MAWDLSNYEDVATLNKWFQENYPMGRIDLKMEWFSLADQEVIFRGEIFRDANDPYPAVSNYARGKASEYPKGMQRWYVEDTATSVIGRCILLLKAADKTATQDSMKQVKAANDMDQIRVQPVITDEKPIANEPEPVVWEEAMTAAQESQDFIGNLIDQLGAKVVSYSCKHGERVFRTGISSKNGKPWASHQCVEKRKGEQCEPIWGKQIGGEWVFEARAAQ
jgi:hypothetical protein